MIFEEELNKSGSRGLNRSTTYGTVAAAACGLIVCLRFATSNAFPSSADADADAGACIAMVWFLLASLLRCHRKPTTSNRNKMPPPIPAPTVTQELALLLPLLLLVTVFVEVADAVVGAAVGFAMVTTTGAATVAAG